MGIKYLWNILTPFCEKRPLYELQGKTVAVDLSCWICEAQNIAEYQVQPKMYLRNLYFRTSFLLLMEVYPIFVLEGKAPELKYDTITARNAIQFKGAKPKTDGVTTGKGRTRFNFVLKQCAEMLGFMGLACLTGKGEAESFCAYLNQEGLVDGCISQDSDCFAYGALTVYRNFSISTQGSSSASGGSIDVYDIRKVKMSQGFGRNKIIALALLCGSDYSNGVDGIGKDSSLKLFEKYSDEEILERMRGWRNSGYVFEEFEKKLADKNICTSCGHQGKLQSHNKAGCRNCGTTSGCDFTKYKDERLFIKNEVNIRNKALQDPGFPNEELIKEYSVTKDKVSKVDLNWEQPNLVNFVKFTVKNLSWEEVYSFEKFLPILTRWQLLNHKNLISLEQSNKLKGVLYPEYIKKKRTPKGVPSYEIKWLDKQNFFKGLIPEPQLLEITDMDKFWSTIEPQHLVEKAYPELVEAFIQSKIKPKKTTRRKKKDMADMEDLNNSLKNISISEPPPKKMRKPRQTKKKSEDEEKPKKVKTLDSFLKQAIINNFNESLNFGQTSTPVKQVSNVCIKNKLDDTLDISNFEDDDDSDLSDIVDNIISKKLSDSIKGQLKNLGYEIADNPQTEHSASFFTNCPVENDLFEKTFDEKYHSDEDLEEPEIQSEECEDQKSFNIECIPLIQRLKNKYL